MSLFAYEVNCMHLNVVMIVKINCEVFQKVNKKTNLKNITIVSLEENINKIVIFTLFNQLIMKCICNK